MDPVKQYYEDSDWLYRIFWYNNKKSLAMHHGFWNSKTKSHEESLLNQYKEIIRLGKIKKGMRVLDTGCGVGGGVRYVGQKTGADVIGITIAPIQVARAKKYGANILLRDFTNTKFPPNSFDVIYGIESVCHASPKSSFLKEAYRLLRPGGTLIINDGYCLHKPLTTIEKKIITDILSGWKLNKETTIAEMNKEIQKAGFKLTKFLNRTELISKSLKRMSNLARIGRFLVFMKAIAGNYKAVTGMTKGVQIGLVGYYTHVAKK